MLFLQCNSEAKVEFELKKSMNCSLAKYAKNQMNCSYSIGDFVKIEIAGVGQKMANIYFGKISGNYSASFLINSQCVHVKNKKDLGDSIFISVKDGKLYKFAQTCPK